MSYLAKTAACNEQKETAQFKEIVASTGRPQVSAVAWRVLDESRGEVDTIEVDMAVENVDDLFDAAGRSLGEGLHKVW